MLRDATPPVQAQNLLDAARAGSEDAFRAVVEDHCAELHAHCYRMLGSLEDAEDALQDTLLRAWRGLPQFAGRSSLRTWLYRIATNACKDAIARRGRRVLPADYGPPDDLVHPDPDVTPLLESVWIEPYPDEAVGVADGYAAPEARYEQREAVELAFVASLQHLPASQRAALILRDVLGFSAREAAETLDTSVASVNSTLQRARAAITERLPERSQQAARRSLGDDRMRKLVDAYVEAWSRADVETLRALLAADAAFSMPPWTSWLHGREQLVRLAEFAVGLCPETRGVATRANGQLAVAFYGLDPATRRFTASSIEVFTFEGAAIKDVTAFVMPEMFPRFGLPATLTL